MKILLAEDRPKAASRLRRGLKRRGYETEWIADEEKALEAALSGRYDLMLLDIVFSEKRTILLRTLRHRGSMLPVLFLTYRGYLEDKIAGLDSGADDYLTRPFRWEELTERIEELVFWRRRNRRQRLCFGDIFLDVITQDLCRGDICIRLGFKEYEMIKCMIQHGGKICPKKLLWAEVWGPEGGNSYNNVEVYMSFLRKKLALLGAQVRIRTMRNRGYRLEMRGGLPPLEMAETEPEIDKKLKQEQ